MSQRSEHETGYAPPRRGPEDGYADDAAFLRGDGRAGAGRPPRRSALAGFLRILLVVFVIVLVLAGALFAAVQFRLIDPVRLGIDSGLFGGSGGAGGSGPPAVRPDVIFAGDPAALAAAPGNIVEPDPSGGSVWLRTEVKAASAAGATDGVAVAIPPALLPKFEGRRVRVTISAKSGTEGTPVPFAAAYSAGAKGNSNWIVFVPEKVFTDHSFSFVVPIGEIGGTGDTHRIAIWSDIEGRGMPLAVRSITIEPD